MKTFCFLMIIVSFSYSLFSQIDSSSTFNDIYNQSCAIVSNRMWSSAGQHQRLGLNWKNVSTEFEINDTANTIFQTAQKQSKLGIGLTASGAALVLGSFPLFAKDVKNKATVLSINSKIGFGLYLSGFVLMAVSASKFRIANNNFEKALWHRNGEILEQNLSDKSKIKFKEIYTKETIYFSNNGFGGYNGYIKNNQKYQFGMFGNLADMEFKSSINGWNSYKKYKNTHRIGFALYATGLIGMLSSFNQSSINQNNLNKTQGIYIGSIIVSSFGSTIMRNALVHLRQAVFFRNRDIIFSNLY